MISEIVLRKNAGISGHKLHDVLYSLKLEHGEPRDFVYADLGQVVIMRSRKWPPDKSEFAVNLDVPPVGDTVAFSLLAHPCYYPKVGRRSAQFDFGDSAARVEWLRRVGSRNGFHLIGETKTRTYYTKVKDDGAKLDHTEFAGTLKVTDADAFEHALVTGIGKLKAFGLGMIRIQRVFDAVDRGICVVDQRVA